MSSQRRIVLACVYSKPLLGYSKMTDMVLVVSEPHGVHEDPAIDFSFPREHSDSLRLAIIQVI